MSGIFHGADAATYRHGNEYVTSSSTDNVAKVIAPIEACNTIHVDQLVSTLLVIAKRMFIRRTDDPQPFEVHALDEIRPLDIQSGDEPRILVHR